MLVFLCPSASFGEASSVSWGQFLHSGDHEDCSCGCLFHRGCKQESSLHLPVLPLCTSAGHNLEMPEINNDATGFLNEKHSTELLYLF